MTGLVRPPAVAGRFYPLEPELLRRTVHDLLADARPPPRTPPPPPTKAIIAPHAGYRYSGPVAASAYAAIAGARGTVTRVIVAGPAHFWPVRGVAVSSAMAFATPLGPVPVDDDARRRTLDVPGVVTDDRAHAGEHSLEVQLPFVMAALGEVSLLPLLVGSAGAGVLAEALDVVWGGPETCVVISTDLSHYLDASTARALDARTAQSICRLDTPGSDAACGAAAVAGMMLAARRHHLDVRLLDLRNSSDTAGRPERVVGYGAFALCHAGAPAGAGS